MIIFPWNHFQEIFRENNFSVKSFSRNFYTLYFCSLPICRLWAEVFHVTTSSSGTVKWTQVSEDLVPVNISCSQDHTGMRFHITAYNSQVEKILDVTLSQPGTRIGQASECFVYWKDDKKNDTWGLNFTSPIDAKQFRECCVSFFSWNHHDNYLYFLEKFVFTKFCCYYFVLSGF